MRLEVSNRHVSVQKICRWFDFDHLDYAPHLQEISKIFFNTAQTLLKNLEDGPMLTDSLRKLWEAKNSAICQAVEDREF